MKKYSVISLLSLLLAGFAFVLPSFAASGCCPAACCQSDAGCCK